MQTERFIEMPVSEIMRRWPATIGVFIDLGMHCVGCPIGMFHTLMEAAEEHRIGFDRLVAEVSAAIDGEVRAGPERGRRRSSSAGGRP
jgi:hybrid cluster-associated redox disulfide protein